MKFFSTNFNGDPNLGMYGFATSKYVLLGEGIKKKRVEEILNVKTVNVTIAGTSLVGLFTAGNSNKVIVPEIIETHERKILEEHFDVLVLKTKFTALGNLILMNDNGCIVSPIIEKHLEEIRKFLGVECVTSRVAKLNVVGSAAVCSNKACLVHPSTTSDEIDTIEKILGTKVGIATANFGSPFIGACILMNDNGVIVSEQTTGPELSMMDDVFREVR